MASLDFEEVAGLLNLSKNTQIDLTPSRRSDLGWALHDAHHKVHASTYPFQILSLQAKITKERIDRLSREKVVTEETHVVYAPSLDRRFTAHRDLFKKKAKGVWSLKDYLTSYLKEDLEKYVTAIKAQKPIYYIDPQVLVPIGIPRKIPNPLLGFLRESNTDRDTPEGDLAVLLAEPGQGKTYMSQYLVSRLAEVSPGLAPIMIGSYQWRQLSVEDLSSLHKTILNSFRHFEAPISWLEGHEELFLRVALKADFFRIVFDGFDEYVLRNGGNVRASEVLEALFELATSTGARILITSRTSFWNMNLSDAELQPLVHQNRLHIYEILPFEPEHAQNYFRDRLQDEKRVAKATQVYLVLRKRNENLAGRGFVLSLVADLVERGSGELPIPDGPFLAFRWLLEQLCERETERQQLPLNGSSQLEVLREFAAEIAMGESPSTETLEYTLGANRPDLDSRVLAQTLEKLSSHPLIERQPGSDRWVFKQAQTETILLAEYMLARRNEDLAGTVTRLKLDAGDREDLAAAIIDLLGSDNTQETTERSVAEMVSTLCSERADVKAAKGRISDAKRLGAALLLAAVDRFLPKGSAHRERTHKLLELCNSRTVAGLAFSGTIARFDFSAVSFSGCIFEKVTWANCMFDERTVFHNCEILGGSAPLHCRGFGNADLTSCRMDQEAAPWVNAIRIAEGKKSYTENDLKNDIHAVISKFISRGGLGLKTVTERDLIRGTIGTSRYRDKIIGILQGTVLEVHDISGISEIGYNVRHSARESVKFYAVNHVFTGQLAEAFEGLKSDLAL